MSQQEIIKVSRFKINCLMENMLVEAAQNQEINQKELYLTKNNNWILLTDELLNIQENLQNNSYQAILTYKQLINVEQIKIILNNSTYICNKQTYTENGSNQIYFGATMQSNFEEIDWSIYPIILKSQSNEGQINNIIICPTSINQFHIQIYICNS